MSNLAYARPLRRPVEHEPSPHIEAVPTPKTRAQSRPRVVYAVTTIASLFVIFAAQLLLSIVVSDGAYQISALQAQQKELLREQQALTEKIDLLSSSQLLAANAANLGMVPGAAPLFLDVSSGGVAAAPGTVDRVGCGGACNLVMNSLITGVPLVSPAPPRETVTAPTTAATTATTTAPPATDAQTGAVTPPPATPVDTIPVPVTH